MTAEELISLAWQASCVPDAEFVATEFARRLQTVEAREGAAARAGLLRVALQTLLERQAPTIASLPYPDDIKQLVRDDFRRQAEVLRESSLQELTIQRYHIRAMFRIAAFHRILVGNEYIEPSVLTRNLLWTGGLLQSIRFLSLASRLRRLQPFYEFHLAPWITRIEQPERVDACRNVARCLAQTPEILGLVGGSWFYDPAMARVSPHLTFLRELVTDNGGFVFRGPRSSETGKLALFKSNTRRRLFEEGLYMPRHFVIVWPREQLLQWVVKMDTDRLALAQTS